MVKVIWKHTLAYLYEGWAAQFLSSLIKNYYICFVGYSINDPIIRYMFDALEADERQGEKISKVWAFAPYSTNNYFIKKNEWIAKGVEPILYEVSNKDHYLLYDTLDKWSKIYQNNEEKKQIIDNEIHNSPGSYSEKNDFIGRMLWVISEPSGTVLKYFINQNPSFDWFIKFYEYKVNCENWFKKSITTILYEPYNKLNLLEEKLLLWIKSFLSDKNFFCFIITQNKIINNKFKNYIKISIYSKQYNIDPTLKFLWDLLTVNKIKIINQYLSWSLWYKNFQNLGLTIPLKLELQNLLSVQIIISKTSYNNSIVSYNFIPTADGLSKWYHGKKPIDFIKILPELFFILQQNLLDCLEIQKTIVQKDVPSEYDCHLPSIEEHPQNNRYNNWTILIELLRDSWIEIYKQDNQRATYLAQNWFNFPYITFKRLAFFAANYDETISPTQWLKWILSDNLIYLWSPYTKREILRLIVKQSKNLSPELLIKLEDAILSHQIQDDSKANSDYAIWLRLKKLQLSISNNQTLTEKAEKKIIELQNKYPSWTISDDQQEEFSTWIGKAEWIDNNSAKIQINTLFITNIKEKLINLDKYNYDKQDEIIAQWETLCKEDYEVSFEILQEVVNKKVWNYKIFEAALWNWSQNSQSFIISDKLLNILLQMPIEIFIELSFLISHYYFKFSQQVNFIYNNSIINLFNKIIKYQCNNEFKPSNITDITNHPLAFITLIITQNIFYQQKISEENKRFLKKLCNTKIISFRYARCILCLSYCI